MVEIQRIQGEKGSAESRRDRDHSRQRNWPAWGAGKKRELRKLGPSPHSLGSREGQGMAMTLHS